MTWKKSTKCESSAWLEVNFSEYVVYVRNTQDPDIVLAFNTEEWKNFIDGVKQGEFDLSS